MSTLFRGKKENTHVLSGYMVENVRSNRPILIDKRSVIVGDIYAPQVVVEGMVYGYVVSTGVTVEKNGQIWGDICASVVDLRPGSKVHGWISSMDEGTVDLLRLNHLSVADIPSSGEYAASADTIEVLERLIPDMEAEKDIAARRMEIWRRLQEEAANAITARIELESTLVANKKEGEQDGDQVSLQVIETPDSTPRVRKIAAEYEETVIKLEQAEEESRQLRIQLREMLHRQLELSNKLRWANISLQGARERVSVKNRNASSPDPKLANQVRGRHLAKIQATIVERDLKIQELKELIGAREEQLFRLKSLSASRIEALETKLDQGVD